MIQIKNTECWLVIFFFMLWKWIVVVQSPHHVQLFVTPMDCSILGLFVLHHLSKFAQVRVDCIGDAIQPSHPLIASSLALSIRAFSSQLFTSNDQNTGVSISASVLPMSIHGWFPLRLTGLICLLPKGHSGVFSSTIIWSYQFVNALPSLWSSSHNHTWPLGNHSLDYRDLFW